ncbi:MAG: hypothetical protein ABXS92_08635 [Sulfurimonas sp.]
MKKLIASFTLLSVVLSADLTVQQIEQMVKKISERREGIKLETLKRTSEPFVRMQESEDHVVKFIVPEKREESRIDLHAIVNEKAYLNESWFEKGDTIMGYTVDQIDNNGVVLKSEMNIKKLFLHDKKNSIIQLTERK